MKSRAKRVRDGLTPSDAREAADVKAARIARQLKIYLVKTRSSLEGRRVQVSFEEILTPAVRFAVMQLRRRTTPSAKKFLAKSAWDDLGRDLSARLALAVTPTLRLQQAAAKAVARSLPHDYNGGRRGGKRGDNNHLGKEDWVSNLLQT